MRTENASTIRRIVLHAVFGLIMVSILALNGCKKDDNDPNPTTQSITQQFNSNDAVGVVTLDDIKLIIPTGAIPKLTNGDPATVNFSIESGGALPKALPSNMKLVGEATHFGPEGFIFQEPVIVLFRLPDGVAPDQVSIIGYDEEKGSFLVYPTTYLDTDTKEVGTMVYKLGFYMLANVEGLNRTRNGASGGIRSKNGNWGWYPLPAGNAENTYNKLIITNFVPSDPSEMALWAPYDPNSNGGQRYWEASTPTKVTGYQPNHELGIVFMGPKGTYTAQLVTSYKESMFATPVCKQYSLPLTFTITSSVTCDQVWGCSGWSTGPTLPPGGTWTEIPCNQYKPLATIPVCTGDFQATLTWFNGSGSYGDTDLDLHLYGPNDLHVYWSNKNPGVGNILLDRDMISETGWVQENICAPTLSAMPKGEYRLEVNLFDGEDKDFQVRLLRGSQANSFTGRATQGEPTKKIITFTL